MFIFNPPDNINSFKFYCYYCFNPVQTAIITQIIMNSNKPSITKIPIISIFESLDFWQSFYVPH